MKATRGNKKTKSEKKLGIKKKTSKMSPISDFLFMSRFFKYKKPQGKGEKLFFLVFMCMSG